MAEKFDPTRMNQAADVANNELQVLVRDMSPEQKEGAKAILKWWNKNYMEAGHKRLFHALRDAL